MRASDVLDRWLGGSEAAIRSLFERARSAAPCVLFFDEIDALATNRSEEDDGGDDSNVHSRVLSTLLNEMDGISSSSSAARGGVLVLAATNRLDSIDSALLRPGRLEEHVHLRRPDAGDIESVLTLYLSGRRNGAEEEDEYEDLRRRLAERMREVGMTGADVEGMCGEAFLGALRRLPDDVRADDISVTEEDFDRVMLRWKTN